MLYRKIREPQLITVTVTIFCQPGKPPKFASCRLNSSEINEKLLSKGGKEKQETCQSSPKSQNATGPHPMKCDHTCQRTPEKANSTPNDRHVYIEIRKKNQGDFVWDHQHTVDFSSHTFHQPPD
ncbi:unnamed protein product [Caenorhabditis auriculariae]|uniref:Uncharacterized protein n=1 Tax=Caenorhabditis auriculariae TaxID=2777116 RepID=A0A8S1GTD6_9PELO|nr:unnamed protein product [Caenorhabditis auriculariae]